MKLLTLEWSREQRINGRPLPFKGLPLITDLHTERYNPAKGPQPHKTVPPVRLKALVCERQFRFKHNSVCWVEG